MLEIVTIGAHDYDHGKLYYSEKRELVRKINPALIIVDCSKECAVDWIFKDLFEIFTPFLEETDRYIHFITTDRSRAFPSKRYIVEDSYGMLLNFISSHINPHEGGEKLDKSFPNFHPSIFSKLFTCYNNRSDFHRKLLVDMLFKEDLFSNGVITYLNPNGHIRPVYEWEYFHGEKLIDDADFTAKRSNYIASSYMTGMIDIVTESVYQANELFVTEKTFKPIFAFKPFLVLGAPYFHKHLQDKYGIELYDEFFDYSFDCFSSVTNRIDGIVRNLQRLKTLSESDLQDFYIKIIPKMVRNKSKLIEICYDKYKIIPKCFHILFNNNNYKVYGNPGEIIGYIRRNKW